jgi:hypothetical protein
VPSKNSRGQLRLDPALPLPQPVHGPVELRHVRLVELQLLGQRAEGGLRVQPPRRRQLRSRIDHPCHDHRHHQVPLLARAPRKQAFQTELGSGAEYGRHVPMRPAQLDLKRFGGWDQDFPAQRPPQDVDRLGREHREVGQGALLGLLADAVGLAQQNGGWGGAVGNDVDVQDGK